MRAIAIQFMSAALFASLASGQTPATERDHVVPFTYAKTEQAVQEIATLVRHMTDLGQVSTDSARTTLSLRGTSDQIALAEWLVAKLDRPAPPARQDQTLEYRLPGGGDNVVRVFYLTHAATPQKLQKIATTVRGATAVRRLFTYNALRALSLRGTSDQIALAGQLIEERDTPNP